MNLKQTANHERRIFLKRSAALAGGAVVTTTTLNMLTAHAALAAQSSQDLGLCGRSPLSEKLGRYGALHPVRDQNGDAILALPQGFSYVTFSKIGDRMSDGNLTPQALDGMMAFPGPDGIIRLIRNHELRNEPGDRTLAVEGPKDTRYDPIGDGGTVTIDFGPKSQTVVRDFVSLNGTIENCAGGYANRDIGWISCEETIAGPNEGWRKKHGYAFLVPVDVNATVKAKPIIGMGRFRHEAAVADPATGIVYQTEDAGEGLGSGFYRYLPKDPTNLYAGGKLQMLRVIAQPQADLRERQKVGKWLNVDWVTIDDPDPDLENEAPGVFDQGYAQGATLFNRLEGIFRGERGSIYFVSTSGGDAKNGDINEDGFAEGYGQIWQYLPGADKDELKLVFESPGGSVLDAPDNLVITPSGGIICCEDDAGEIDGDTHPLAPGITDVNRLIGLTHDGEPFEFAVNRLNNTEFAGATFSPDGNIFFVNIYGDGTPGSGMTCAITGPWNRGPL